MTSVNLVRRHLDVGMRALIGRRIANLSHGGDRKADQAANLPLDPKTTAVTQAEAAKLMNVSERAIRQAGVVLDKGTPALVKKVEGGEVSVSAAAAIAKAPAETQEAIADLPADAIKVAAKVIKKDPAVVKQLQAKLAGGARRLQ